MKRFLTLLLVVGIASAMSTTAWAGLSWQTEPILGTDMYDTGDVVIVTDTGLATIPHYSIVGDPLYHVGASMKVFDWTGKVANGSGINVDVGHTYDWTAVYTNLGTGYTDSSANVYFAPAEAGGFVMLKGYLWGIGGTSTLGPGDVGSWTYTETWTDRDTSVLPISYSADFSVVPEPATIVVWSLLGLVGAGFGFWRRKK